MSGLRRHESPCLGEHDDKRVLAQEGGLACHVGSGNNEDPRACFVIVAKAAVIADEACAIATLQRLLDDRMAAVLDREGAAFVHLGAHIVLLGREFRETCIVVEFRKRGARGRQRLFLGENLLCKLREDVELKSERAIGCRRDARIKLGEFGRREPHRIGHGLTVNERLHMRRVGQRRCLQRSDLHEVTENVVVTHLERLDAGGLCVGRLQARNHLPAAVPQRSEFIQIGAVASAYERPVAGVDGEFVGECGL